MKTLGSVTKKNIQTKYILNNKYKNKCSHPKLSLIIDLHEVEEFGCVHMAVSFLTKQTYILKTM